MVCSPYSTRSSKGQVGTVAGLGRPVDHDQMLVGHVTDQDADDAEGTTSAGCRARTPPGARISR
jgi:hypothetical protein